jgi:hypothetical protein
MDFKVNRTDQEIDDLENAAAEGENEGTKFPGMNYEQGILETLRWLRGDTNNSPMAD